MPLFDYLCEKCGHEFEYLCSMERKDAPTEEPCPNCGENFIKKIYKNGSGGLVDHGIINADKNMAKSGIGDALTKMKEHHKYMQWKG